MGWSSGTRVFLGLVEVVKANVPDHETRKDLYDGFIDVFMDADWDNPEEVLGEDKAYDEVYYERYPEEKEEDEDFDEDPYWVVEEDD